MSTQNVAKNRIAYECNICNYNTSNKYDYEKHVKTIKHKNNESSTKQAILATNLSQKSQDHNFICYNCNRHYKDKSGLWRHKQKCKLKEDSECETEQEKKYDEVTDKNLIMMLINENKELKTMMLEQQNMMLKVIETGTNNTTNITHTNSHNKAFNLNFFLNETCKDAMNIMDFVESIKLQLSDLERVGEKGYIEGISNIIIKNLKDLDVTQRPVHCTDKKRETIYVKDEDKWEKDNENKKMHKLVRKIQDKNFRMIQKFKEKYPNYYKASSKESDVYNNIIIESMGGKGDNDFEKEEKIIKRVSKEIGVEK